MSDPRKRSRRRFKIGGRRKTDNPDRRATLEKLVELSTDPDSLDWDVLQNINTTGWGCGPDGCTPKERG